MKTVALIAGCFDGGVHRGHRFLLSRASQYSDYLILLVNSDEYIISTKGRQPLFPLKERIRMLRETGYPDEVLPLYDESPLKMILEIKPDILIVGDDYAESEIVGLKEGAAWGCRAVIVPRLAGFSTTELIKAKNDFSI